MLSSSNSRTITLLFIIFTFSAYSGRAVQETGSSSAEPVKVSSDKVLASATHRVAPVYPAEAKQALIGGAVTVEVIINESGDVEYAQATTGNSLLKDSAVAAARQWKFPRWKVDDTPVKVSSTITFNFIAYSGTSASVNNDEEDKAALREAEQRSYEKGQKDGYERGSKDGKAKGYDEGVAAGRQTSEAEANQKANTLAEGVRQALTWLFSWLFYPIVVVGIFVYIIWMITRIIIEGKGAGRIRRSVGAALPLLILVFFVVTGQDKDNPINALFENISQFWRFIIGVCLGIFLMEIGKLLLNIDSEISSSLYALFLSVLGAFLIWSIMGGLLQAINFTLLGLVIAGCLHVVFRGPPDI
jgi:TonB family protein